jgi:hypothetical protein
MPLFYLLILEQINNAFMTNERNKNETFSFSKLKFIYSFFCDKYYDRKRNNIEDLNRNLSKQLIITRRKTNERTKVRTQTMRFHINNISKYDLTHVMKFGLTWMIPPFSTNDVTYLFVCYVIVPLWVRHISVVCAVWRL